MTGGWTDGLTEGREKQEGRKERKRDKIRSCNYPAAAANENTEVSGVVLADFLPLTLT